MITREEAVDVIYGLINGQLIEEELDEETENLLTDIAQCIEAEKIGIHAWGMDDKEWVFLHTAFRTDLPDFADNMKKQREIAERYAFKEIEWGE